MLKLWLKEEMRWEMKNLMACQQKRKFSASIHGFVIPEKVTMQEMFPTAPHIATIIWNVATDNGAVHPLNGNTCAIPHNTILILTNNTPSVQNRNIVWKSSLLRLEFNILSVEFSINLKFSISASLKSSQLNSYYILLVLFHIVDTRKNILWRV